MIKEYAEPWSMTPIFPEYGLYSAISAVFTETNLTCYKASSLEKVCDRTCGSGPTYTTYKERGTWSITVHSSGPNTLEKSPEKL